MNNDVREIKRDCAMPPQTADQNVAHTRPQHEVLDASITTSREPRAAADQPNKLFMYPRRAALFLAVTLPLAFAWAVIVPPFQVPDEPAHLCRAAQLAHGQLRPEQRGQSTGGQVNRGMWDAIDFLNKYLPAAAGPTQMAQLHRMSWSQVDDYRHFPNTVRYGPLFYLPQAIGLAIGEVSGASALQSMCMARLLNALAALAIAALAIGISRRGHMLLLFTLLLPMSTFEIASLAQDASIIACSALVAALIERAEDVGNAGFALLAVALTSLILARLPLAAFLPLLFLPSLQRRTRRAYRWSAITATCITCAVWNSLVLRVTGQMRPNVPSSPIPQLTYLLQHPAMVLKLPWDSAMRDNWWRTMVGISGWLTVDLAAWVYSAAIVALILACLHAALQKNKRSLRERYVIAASIVSYILLTLWATYLTWTPVGAPHIEGVQGRYFLSIIPVLGCVLPQLRLGKIMAHRGASSLGRWRAYVADYSLSIVGWATVGIIAVLAADGFMTVRNTYRSSGTWLRPLLMSVDSVPEDPG